MSGFTLVLGGARSGKSRYGQTLAAEMAHGGPVVYLATAEAKDEEMHARIRRHRAERPAHWRTVEEPLQVPRVLAALQDAPVVIIDCFTLYLSNHLLAGVDPAAPEPWNLPAAERAAAELVRAVSQVKARVVLISNELGLGLVPDTPMGRVFRDLMGFSNQLAAASADAVFLLVSGLPMRVK